MRFQREPQVCTFTRMEYGAVSREERDWLRNCLNAAMLSRRKLDCTVLMGAVALTRFLFRSHYLYDIDSVNFALAMGRFDPAVHQPHPPGYFLYICLARLVNALLHDANAALVAISIAASCGAAAMIYVLADEWFGIQPARFAGLLFLFSPLAWFHGTVALTYIVEAFFSALVGYICWRVYEGRSRWIVLGAFTLGIAAGVRPSSLLFLGPLFLFSFRSVPRKQAFIGIGVLIVTLLAWFVPMILVVGGLRTYALSLLLLWKMAPGRLAGFNSIGFMSIARFCTILLIYFLCFGCAVLLVTRFLFKRQSTSEPRKAMFTWVWIAPALLFFTFVFLLFINSGYLLITFPPLCAWLGLWASEWYEEVRFMKPLKLALVGLAAALNVAIFLRAPVYCSHAAVRRLEAELRNVQRALPQVASARGSLIIGVDSHFLGFRHAGYYFPEYRLAEFPAIQLPTGKRVFTMQHRDTRLVGQLDKGSFENFVFFPLPPGPTYAEKMSELRAKFPPEDLLSVKVAGCEFLTGRIADLSFLFPVAAASKASLYTAHRSAARDVYGR
jgi:transmembrane protein TMEM260 (protein O-mannosyltransferase)